MPPPREWVLTCPYCSASPAPFQPQGRIESHDGEGARTFWQPALCPACGGAVIARLAQFDGDLRVAATFPRAVGDWDVADLPDAVQPSWDEAMTVYKAGAYSSAVVMCGRTLEAAADARGIGKGTLQQRVHQMLERGLITEEFKAAMTYTRMMRNVGAHAGQTVSPDSAAGAMSFTQQTLRLLFEIPAHLRRLTEPKPDELDDDETPDDGG
jgi:hypothetical protein